MTILSPEIPPERDKDNLANRAASEFTAWKREQKAKREANHDLDNKPDERRPDIDTYGTNGIFFRNVTLNLFPKP